MHSPLILLFPIATLMGLSVPHRHSVVWQTLSLTSVGSGGGGGERQVIALLSPRDLANCSEADRSEGRNHMAMLSKAWRRRIGTIVSLYVTGPLFRKQWINEVECLYFLSMVTDENMLPPGKNRYSKYAISIATYRNQTLPLAARPIWELLPCSRNESACV